MRAFVISGTSFTAGFVVAFVCVAAIDVYALGHVENIQGAKTTFLMLAWLGPVVGLVGAFAYLLGAKLSGFMPPARPSTFSGGLNAVLFWSASWASQYFPGANSILAPWALVLAGSLLAARVIRARSARGSAPPDR